MRSSAQSHSFRMQTSSTERKEMYQTAPNTDEKHRPHLITDTEQNWNPNLPKQHFLTLGHAVEKDKPSTLGDDSAASTPSTSPSSPFTTGRTSISSASDQNVFEEQKTTLTSTFLSASSMQPYQLQGSDKASECDVSSRQRARTGQSMLSASFAQPTASSRKRSEKINHPNPKPKDWTPSFTKAKSPRLRSIGKASTFTSVRDKTAKSSRSESSKCSETTSHRNKLPTPSMPKTPNVLRRKTFFSRKYTAQEEPKRTFVPNPTPQYLKKGNLPEIKQTRKSQQLAEIRKNGGRLPKDKGPKKVASRVSVEPTAVKPFDLGSVVKHEERVHQINARIAAEEEEDKKRREFRPVELRPEILEGPTFVPRRSESPLTTPVDLLPHAQDRSQRTLAFEARQRARMAELEHNKEIAEKEQEKLEEERLRKEYESKRFKSRPVPNSHYKPDIDPAGVKNDADREDGTSKSLLLQDGESETHMDTLKKTAVKDTKKVYDENADSAYNTKTPSTSERKAVANILEGIRKSLSPLLGRSSTSL